MFLVFNELNRWFRCTLALFIQDTCVTETASTVRWCILMTCLDLKRSDIPRCISIPTWRYMSHAQARSDTKLTPRCWSCCADPRLQSQSKLRRCDAQPSGSGTEQLSVAKAHYAAAPVQRNKECWVSKMLGMFHGNGVFAIG